MMRDQLADHYLKSAGIAAICIAADGEVTAYATIGIGLPAGLVCYGCMRGDVERLAAPARRCRGDQAKVAAQVEQLAADLYVGLSRDADIVARAMHAVAAVDPVSARCRPMAAWLRSTAPSKRRAPRRRRCATAITWMPSG